VFYEYAILSLNMHTVLCFSCLSCVLLIFFRLVFQVREIAADSLGATASAIHLCIRNLLGGLGPLAVALLSSKLDSLQQAMLFIPACYATSGAMFLLTELVTINENATEAVAEDSRSKSE
jgi:hypothetical protein